MMMKVNVDRKWEKCSPIFIHEANECKRKEKKKQSQCQALCNLNFKVEYQHNVRKSFKVWWKKFLAHTSNDIIASFWCLHSGDYDMC